MELSFFYFGHLIIQLTDNFAEQENKMMILHEFYNCVLFNFTRKGYHNN